MSARPGTPPSTARRTLDVVVSVVALLVLSPLVLLVALAVACTSRGPIIFAQVRVGQGGAPFTLWKFRTMRPGSGGPDVTPAGDSRLTPIGRLLRTSGLDELPQLVNILRGDMTVVGPRPETPALASRYTPWCAQVFEHRPGLTGPASIRLRDKDSLPPGIVDVEQYYLDVVVAQKVALDLAFLADPSVRATLSVIVETVTYIASGGRSGRVRSVQRSGAAPARTGEPCATVPSAPIATTTTTITTAAAITTMITATAPGEGDVRVETCPDGTVSRILRSETTHASVGRTDADP